MKKKIVFIINSQFGYSTAHYYYCTYLDKSKFDVHYVGFDMGLPRRNADNVCIHYIRLHSNKIMRFMIYLTTINHLIRTENFNILFLVDCRGSLLIRLCNLTRKAVMDIRTGDVFLGTKLISFYNLNIRLSSLFFNNITILSDSLRKLLKLPVNKCHIIPLGAEQLNVSNKTFNDLNLFYIGSLQERHIHQTIEGLSIFMK